MSITITLAKALAQQNFPDIKPSLIIPHLVFFTVHFLLNALDSMIVNVDGLFDYGILKETPYEMCCGNRSQKAILRENLIY